MFDYIKGKLVELTPTYAVIENNHIGYLLNISLTTSSELKNNQECQLFIHEVIREDSHTLFGFIDKQEREIFQLLISVNGVGPNTGRLILSSIPYKKLIDAILAGDSDLIKSVKGIGTKTAQRIIIDLKDKLGKQDLNFEHNLDTQNNSLANDSLSALIMLGFTKSSVQKAVNKVLKNSQNTADLTVEEVVKKALNHL